MKKFKANQMVQNKDRSFVVLGYRKLNGQEIVLTKALCPQTSALLRGGVAFNESELSPIN